MIGNHTTAVTADVMTALAAADRSSVARSTMQIANAIAGTTARYAPPGRTAASVTLIATQQSAWPMNRPSNPPRAWNGVAQLIAVAAPISHIAAMIGPGCATQFAAGTRSDVSQPIAPPAIAAPRSVMKNEKTPDVTALAVVSASRMRRVAPKSTPMRAAIDIHSVHGCGHHSVPIDITSKNTASASVA